MLYTYHHINGTSGKCDPFDEENGWIVAFDDATDKVILLKPEWIENFEKNT